VPVTGESRTRTRKPSEIVLDVSEKRERGLLEHEPGLLGVESVGNTIEKSLDLAVHDNRVQALLASEVLVDQRFRDLGTLCDLLDRGCLETLSREDAASDLDELLATLLARHAGAPALLAHAAPRVPLRLLVFELLERHRLDIPSQP